MSTTPRRRRLGWIPDLPDHRDHRYAVPRKLGAVARPPARVDLRPRCPPVDDQGALSACVGEAVAFAFRFVGPAGATASAPSRLFVYYGARARGGNADADTGASLRDAIQAVAADGVCAEALWPYDPARVLERPADACYAAARRHTALNYQRLDRSAQAVRACLAEGFPVVFGATLYESFEAAAVAASGVVPMPLRTERVVGGHAMALVGYDDQAQRFWVRNSWGQGWGQAGYCTLPYDYVLGPLADDCWTIRAVR